MTILNDGVRIRRMDVANILLRNGYKIIVVVRDTESRWASNYIFERADGIEDAVDKALEELNIRNDIIPRPKRFDGHKRDNEDVREKR